MEECHLFTPFDEYEKTKIHHSCVIALQNRELFKASILNYMVISYPMEVESWKFRNNYRNNYRNNRASN
jgi:hypothetical protein